MNIKSSERITDKHTSQKTVTVVKEDSYRRVIAEYEGVEITIVTRIDTETYSGNDRIVRITKSFDYESGVYRIFLFESGSPVFVGPKSDQLPRTTSSSIAKRWALDFLTARTLPKTED